MADEKIVARIQKLLRMAAPTSGASQSEREIAALEAAKLIAEHGVAVGASPPTSPAPALSKRSPARESRRDRHDPLREEVWRQIFDPPASAPDPRPFGDYTLASDWTRAIATRSAICVDDTCRGAIAPGDPVWRRRVGNVVEYLHADGPCRW